MKRTGYILDVGCMEFSRDCGEAAGERENHTGGEQLLLDGASGMRRCSPFFGGWGGGAESRASHPLFGTGRAGNARLEGNITCCRVREKQTHVPLSRRFSRGWLSKEKPGEESCFSRFFLTWFLFLSAAFRRSPPAVFGLSRRRGPAWSEHSGQTA